MNRIAVGSFLLSIAFSVWSMPNTAPDSVYEQDLVEDPAKRYVAALEVNSVEELEKFLDRVETEYVERDVDGPVVLVLHGQEISSFIVDNYSRYQSVVEKSTELTAKGYVQIEICERWLGANGAEGYRLQPFVKTVNYAPERVKGLTRQQYSYF